MKNAFLIIVVFILAFLSSCNEDSTSPKSVDIDLLGYWKAHVVDGDRDGVIDTVNEKSHVFLLHVTKYDGNTIEGKFIRIAFGGIIEGDVYGQRSGDHISLSIKDSMEQEVITFDIDLTIDIDDIEEEYLIADWKTSDGDSDKVIFFKRNELTDNAAQLINNPLIQNKDGYLEERGGSGSQAVIFIHGYHSNPGTWNKMIERLLEHGYGNKHKLYTFEYDWHKHITYNGKRLLDVLIEKEIARPIIVATSMGGMVARSYVSYGGELTQLITTGTPHFGTPISALPSILTALKLLGADISYFNDFAGDGPTDLNWVYYPYIFDQNSDKSEMDYSERYTVFFGQIVKHYVCKWYFHGCRVGTWEYNHNYGITYETTYEIMNNWGGPNDGVIPTYSAASDVNSAHNNNKQEVPDYWAFPYAQRLYAGDWDHSHLCDPDKVTEVFDFILNHTK